MPKQFWLKMELLSCKVNTSKVTEKWCQQPLHVFLILHATPTSSQECAGLWPAHASLKFACVHAYVCVHLRGHK